MSENEDFQLVCCAICGFFLAFSDNPDNNILCFQCLAVAILATVRICCGIHTEIRLRRYEISAVGYATVCCPCGFLLTCFDISMARQLPILQNCHSCAQQESRYMKCV